MKRRDLIIALSAVGVVVGIPPLLRWARSDFEFEPLSGFDGFRRLKGEAISALPDFLAGLDTPSSDQTRDLAAIHHAPCTFLFGQNWAPGGPLPIAVFSDYFCPYCAVLSRHLIRLQKERSDIQIILHELPLLGPRSVDIAKVALAAKRQGKHLSAHIRLMDKMLPPGPVALRRFAEELDLDPEQMVRDANGSEVAAELRLTGSLGSALGIVGTPATMFGRTLVVGSISPREVERLVNLEISEPFDRCG